MKNKVTISDIAKLAQVSKSTVSFYLNGHYDKMSKSTRERIKQVIAMTRYQPSAIARSLNSKQTRLIGVIIGDITSSFANQVVKGLNDYVQKHDYQLILGSTNYRVENERKCLNAMNNMGVDGFVVQPTPQFETLWQEMAIERPLVYFDSPTKNTSTMYVKANNYQAVYNAIQLMVDKGYKRFLMVMGDPDVIVTRQERSEGFRDCLGKHKLPYDIILTDHEAQVDDLRLQLESYIRNHEDLCIFAASNWILKKVHLALEPFRHLIPQQLGLLGMDAFDWSSLVDPTITTIVQPTGEEGIMAGRILIDYLEGKNKVEHTCILNCGINEMDSTRKI